jgi:hypothetical protein
MCHDVEQGAGAAVSLEEEGAAAADWWRTTTGMQPLMIACNDGGGLGSEGGGSGWQRARAVSAGGVGLAPAGGGIVEHTQHRTPQTHANRPKLNLVNSAQS